MSTWTLAHVLAQCLRRDAEITRHVRDRPAALEHQASASIQQKARRFRAVRVASTELR